MCKIIKLGIGSLFCESPFNNLFNFLLNTSLTQNGTFIPTLKTLADRTKVQNTFDREVRVTVLELPSPSSPCSQSSQLLLELGLRRHLAVTLFSFCYLHFSFYILFCKQLFHHHFGRYFSNRSRTFRYKKQQLILLTSPKNLLK